MWESSLCNIRTYDTVWSDNWLNLYLISSVRYTVYSKLCRTTGHNIARIITIFRVNRPEEMQGKVPFSGENWFWGKFVVWYKLHKNWFWKKVMKYFFTLVTRFLKRIPCVHCQRSFEPTDKRVFEVFEKYCVASCYLVNMYARDWFPQHHKPKVVLNHGYWTLNRFIFLDPDKWSTAYIGYYTLKMPYIK
jgi:hypothetical protein